MDFTKLLISFILFVFTYVEIHVFPPSSVHLFSSFLSFLHSLSE